MSTDGRMNKETVACNSMKWYSAMKKEEILPFVTTWMNLEAVTLNETSQV